MKLIIIFTLFQSVLKCRGQIISAYEPRILGGSNTPISDVPYIVSVRYTDSLICGGSLIKPNVVVSAAHCLDGSENIRDLKVVAGTDLTIGVGGVASKVFDIIRHEKYDPYTLDYDIMLLVLETAFELSDKIQLIKLPIDDIPVGTPVLIAGWGLPKIGGISPDILQSVTVNIILQEYCAKRLRPKQVTDRMLCAGVEEGGKDACTFDSGGPLVANNQLYGIVSWGISCGEPGYPGVYTRVTSVKKWIEDKIQ